MKVLFFYLKLDDDPLPAVHHTVLPAINYYEYGMGNLITSVVMTAAGCKKPDRLSGDSVNPPIASKFEEIRQSILTIETLISNIPSNEYKNFYNRSSPLNVFPKNTYQSTDNVKYFKGQWIDCLDTVNHWLESTILDVNEDEVYVHYNGWSNSWNEWINKHSNRLAPFRTHTLHSYLSSHYCPTPFSFNSKAHIRDPELDKPETVFQTLPVLINKLLPSIEELSHICKERSMGNAYIENSELKEFTDYLTPLVDRLGRILVDVAPEIKKMGETPNRDSNILEKLTIPPYVSSNYQSTLVSDNEGYNVPLLNEDDDESWYDDKHHVEPIPSTTLPDSSYFNNVNTSGLVGGSLLTELGVMSITLNHESRSFIRENGRYYPLIYNNHDDYIPSNPFRTLINSEANPFDAFNENRRNIDELSNTINQTFSYYIIIIRDILSTYRQTIRNLANLDISPRETEDTDITVPTHVYDSSTSEEEEEENENNSENSSEYESFSDSYAS